jgi:CrcB protein
VSSVVIWVTVALLGGAGAVARFGIDGFAGRRTAARFPWGTLAVNLSGSFLLGVIVGAGLHHDARLLAGTALLGSYTTFSTWMLETQRLAEDGAFAFAWLNVSLSLVAGVGAAELGRLIG